MSLELTPGRQDTLSIMDEDARTTRELSSTRQALFIIAAMHCVLDVLLLAHYLNQNLTK